MKITCHFQPAAAQDARWVADLRKALPEADIHLWTPGDGPADYAVVWRPSAGFFAQQAQLKAVFNAGAGVDALLSGSPPSSAPIVRLEDAGMAEQMCEYVTYAVLRHFREFATYEASQRAGAWEPRPPRRKSDHPIGVLGLGVLGERVALALRRFGFTVRAWTRSPRAAAEDIVVSHGLSSLPAFLGDTRILVCLLPLTAETAALMDHTRLRLLPRGAYVINVARGAHIVEADLLQALDDDHLSGAMLDVFHDEPLPADHPFWRHPKVTLTPHISAATLREDAVSQIAAKIRALEAGREVTGVVDLRRGY